MSFTAWSNSFQQENQIPEKYAYDRMGCHGKNISPALEWKDPPQGTESFAVTMHDPDAPHIGGWWHWAVVNIPATVTSIPEGASNDNKLPVEAVEVKTNYGESHYGGPCPPQGDRPHHYVFTVYALKKESVHLTPNSTPGSIKHELEHECLDKASFTALYGR